MTLVALAGCSYLSFPSWPTHLIYKVDIQQGAIVTKEMAEQLRPGMTREQVRFVLGTPPIADPFHNDRWDYTYRFQPGRGDVVLRHFTVYFKDDKFLSAQGDALPTEAEFIATRIRLNTEQAKLSGVGSTTAVVPPEGSAPAVAPAVAPAPGSASDASTPPTSSSAPSTGTPNEVSPSAASRLPQTSSPAVPPANATEKDSPSIWDRIKNAFGGESAPISKPVAPSTPNGPDS